MSTKYQTDPTGEITRRISTFAHETQWDDIPAPVQHAAKRSILNVFATALGGAREPAIEKSLRVLMPFSGERNCSIIGRAERGDMLLAAYVNAMAANIADYDDTHPATIIHPTAPVAPALLAFAERNRRTGRELLRAFILGAEIECRLGNAMSPYHYAHGWHITSTCGVFGSAIGVAVLAGLSVDRFGYAIANAAAQSAGMVETLGTMSKSISVGNAARGGLMSALLAAEEFSGPVAPLEGARGYLSVYSNEPKAEALVMGLGEVWEIGKNTFKPYPVGVVLNPVLEACIDFHRRRLFAAEEVAGVELTGHPLLQQRADRADVTSGRESQVSAQHAIAIALRRGRAGLAEFDDAAVTETLRDKIRPAVTFVDDERYDIESVRIVVTTKSGEIHAADIKDTRGGSVNPLSDEDLTTKLLALAEYGGFEGDVVALAEAVWGLDQCADAGSVMQLARR